MDLTLVTRLAGDQLMMDTATALTKGTHPLEAALLTIVPLADLGLPTLVLRDQEHGYIGQLKHRTGDTHAHLVMLAPSPVNEVEPWPWVQLVEGLLQVAVQRGATTTIAELPETASAAFKILRQAGFVVYARQTIYHYQPSNAMSQEPLVRVQIRPVQSADLPHLQLLYAKLVPSLIQQACPLSKPNIRNHDSSLVVQSVEDGRLLGHLGVVEGRSGLLMRPLLHPDIYEEASGIFQQALALWPKAERLPLYACIRSYQEWLGIPLEDAGMHHLDRQVLFVKHMAVRVKPVFERATSELATVGLGKWVNSRDIELQQDQNR